MRNNAGIPIIKAWHGLLCKSYVQKCLLNQSIYACYLTYPTFHRPFGFTEPKTGAKVFARHRQATWKKPWGIMHTLETRESHRGLIWR